MGTLASSALLLLLLAGAVSAEAARSEYGASEPTSSRTAGAGPLRSSGDDGTVPASVQDGPVGAAAATYTVDGSLIFGATGNYNSNNLFQFSDTGDTGQAAWAQSLPTSGGAPSGFEGPYGNQGGPTGVAIGTGIEFATGFRGQRKVTELFDDFQAQIYVNIADNGDISVTRRVTATAMPVQGLVGTITLQSSLFEGAASITGTVGPATRMEDVLADSFELEDTKEAAASDNQAAAAAPPSKAVSEPARATAARPAQPSWVDLQASVANSAQGIITITIPETWRLADLKPFTQTFTVGLAPKGACTAGGVCCDDAGNPKNGTVCRRAPPGSCQLDMLCDGVNADCPAPPSKHNGAHCPWFPRRSYLMGEAVDAGDAKVVGVSAYDAAAWLTGQPAYDTEWPECQGKCINGNCALRWDHPACCFVHPRGDYDEDRGYHGGRPYAEQEAEQDVAVSSLGYWRSRDWYCWK